MNLTSLEEICAALEVDLCVGRLELVAANGRLRLADTAENRAAAARCRARADVVADLLVELTGGAPSRPIGARTGRPSTSSRPGLRRGQSLFDPPGRPSRM